MNAPNQTKFHIQTLISFMDYRDFLESNSDVMLGKPVIKGTRITVELVLKKMSEGASVEDIIMAYPILTINSVKAVLAYASDMVSNETLIAAA